MDQEQSDEIALYQKWSNGEDTDAQMLAQMHANGLHVKWPVSIFYGHGANWACEAPFKLAVRVWASKGNGEIMGPALRWFFSRASRYLFRFHQCNHLLVDIDYKQLGLEFPRCTRSMDIFHRQGIMVAYIWRGAKRWRERQNQDLNPEIAWASKAIDEIEQRCGFVGLPMPQLRKIKSARSAMEGR